jgi:MFS family permease
MITADVVRALLLGLVVTLALTGRLTLPLLYACVFVLGAFTVTYDIAQFTVMPALVVFLEVTAHSSATSVGLAFGAYGGGFLLAAALATPLRRRWGTAANVIGSSLLSGAGVAVLAVDAALRFGSMTVAAGAFLVGFAGPVFNVQSVALRLSVSPPELLGRVNAVVKFVSQGSLPLGALAAGGLFSVLSPAGAFAVVAAGSLLATAILVVSPVRERLRRS